MILNPYEAPLTADPLTTPRGGRWQVTDWLCEIGIGCGYVVMLLFAAVHRLQVDYQVQLLPDLKNAMEQYGLFAGVGLICFAGLRGLYYVIRRKQQRSVANGLICVAGFCCLIGAALLVVG